MPRKGSLLLLIAVLLGGPAAAQDPEPGSRQQELLERMERNQKEYDSRYRRFGPCEVFWETWKLDRRGVRWARIRPVRGQDRWACRVPPPTRSTYARPPAEQIINVHCGSLRIATNPETGWYLPAPGWQRELVASLCSGVKDSGTATPPSR